MRIAQTDAMALTECRYQTELLEAMRESWENWGARDSSFDGMPRVRGRARGLDDELTSKEAARLRLLAQQRRTKRAKRKAADVIRRLRLDVNAACAGFIQLYFLDGLCFKAAQMESGASARSAWQYKAEVIRAAKGIKKEGG